MTLDQIKQKGKCCVTEKPLSTSKHIHAIFLDCKAQWKYPTHGNILTGPGDMAVAFIHDDAIDPAGMLTGKVQFAVEVSGEEIIYHEIEKLQTV